MSLALFSVFKIFFQFVSSTVNDLLLRFSFTIWTDFKWVVSIRITAIRDALAAANSKVHFICDAWISLNGYTIWGVQANFLNNQYRKQELLIKLKQLQKNHKRNTLALITLNIAEFFNTIKKLGYLVMDNAFFNDTLVDIIESEMKEHTMQWNTKQHKIHCFEHIVNLTAAAFIYQEISDENLPAEDNNDVSLAVWGNCITSLCIHNTLPKVVKSLETLLKTLTCTEITKQNRIRGIPTSRKLASQWSSKL